MPAGRPSKYRQEYCDLLVKHMEDGLSFESFAGVVHVDRDTIYEWANKHKEFSDAKKRGQALCQIWWESKGKEGLFTGKDEKFNATVWLFNMKNRFGWRDQQSIEHSGPDGKPISIDTRSHMTDDELKSAAIFAAKNLMPESK